jgi:hypothetical protein
MYAAQEIPQIDAEIAQKGHFRMETNWVSYEKLKLPATSYGECARYSGSTTLTGKGTVCWN